MSEFHIRREPRVTVGDRIVGLYDLATGVYDRVLARYPLLVVVGQTFLSLVLIGIYAGWAGSWLWLWYMVPLGVPAINTAHGAGLVLLLGIPMLSGRVPETPTAALIQLLNIAVSITLTISFGLLFSFFR